MRGHRVRRRAMNHGFLGTRFSNYSLHVRRMSRPLTVEWTAHRTLAVAVLHFFTLFPWTAVFVCRYPLFVSSFSNTGHHCRAVGGRSQREPSEHARDYAVAFRLRPSPAALCRTLACERVRKKGRGTAGRMWLSRRSFARCQALFVFILFYFIF